MSAYEQLGAGAADVDSGAQALDGAAASWEPSAFLGLALAGLGISTYLTVAHYEQVPLACTTNGVIDCAAVTQGIYGQFLGTAFPVAASGLVWFGLAAVLGVLWLRAARAGRAGIRHPTQALVLAAVGIAYALYLVFVEVVRVHRICEWCTVVHLTVFVMLCISFLAVQRAQQPACDDPVD